jgi:hypothetical protein
MKKSNNKTETICQSHSETKPKPIVDSCPKCGSITIIIETDLTTDEVPMYACQCDCGNIAYVSENALLSGEAKCCGYCNSDCECNEGIPNVGGVKEDRREHEWQKQEAKIHSQEGQNVYFYNEDGSLRYVGKCLGHRQFCPCTLEHSLSDHAPLLQPLMIWDDDYWLWELACWAETEMDLPTFRIGDVDYYNEIMALSYTGIKSKMHAQRIYEHWSNTE